MRTEVIHSCHSVEEDLWEISGLPVPKGGPGGGCPKIPANQIIQDSKVVDPYYSTSAGCPVGNNTSDVTLWCYARYYRYGILFEMLMRSRETDWPSLPNNAGITCNSITLHSLRLEYRRNAIAQPFNIVPSTRSAKGEVQYKPYSDTRRLCWFIWKGKTSRSAVNKETGTATIKWNYTE